LIYNVRKPRAREQRLSLAALRIGGSVEYGHFGDLTDYPWQRAFIYRMAPDYRAWRSIQLYSS
jgi:hypothetical protein